jgi:hypothetical protein
MMPVCGESVARVKPWDAQKSFSNTQTFSTG